jgi:carbon-monoxide dehydrogenase large subunit
VGEQFRIVRVLYIEPMATYVGSRVRKLGGAQFLTGRAGFVDDVRLPGTAYLAVLRSAEAHARLVRVDAEAARSAPGVLAALTGEEATHLANPIPQMIDLGSFGGRAADVRCLATGRVRYAGEPIAAVVAETRADAEAALALIEVEYELLPAVLTPDDALADGAPLLYEDWDENVLARGHCGPEDVTAALDASPHVLDDEIRIQRYTSAPIETRGYVADWNDRDDSLTFYGTCQKPHPLRWALSRALDLPESRIRIVVPDLGGAFGLKIHSHPEETLVCVLSRLVRRPVKWIEDRRECFLVSGREQVHSFSVGYDGDGTILAFRDRIVADVGAIGVASGWAMVHVAAVTFPSGYRVRDCEVSYEAVVTNKPYWSACRGFGKEATNLVMERAVDMVARRLGLDPADVRRRNFIGADEFPFRTSAGLNIDSGDYHAALDRLLTMLDYRVLRSDQLEAREQGRYLGVGLAFELTPEAAALTGTLSSGYDSTTVRMDPSGTVTVLTGVTSLGGGNDTGIAQVVADELGVRLEEVTVVQGDTSRCPYGLGTSTGRALVVGGGAAVLAARELRRRLVLVAAEMLGAGPDGVSLGGGSAFADGRSVSIADVAYAIYTMAHPELAEPPLEVTRAYRPDNVRLTRDESGRTQPYPTYSNAVHGAVVEVDVETGKVDVRRYAVVHDCGTMINPDLVEGQMQGAVAMGIGGALSEELRYDDGGRLGTDGFKRYLVPRAGDLPPIEVEHQVTPSPFTVLGNKGAGEAGVGGAIAAVAGAVEDALAPLGVTVRTLPLTPPNVLAAIEDARSERGPQRASSPGAAGASE